MVATTTGPGSCGDSPRGGWAPFGVRACAFVNNYTVPGRREEV